MTMRRLIEEGQTHLRLASEPSLYLLEKYAGGGVMIALFPPKAVQKKLAKLGSEGTDDIHLTLAYLGNSSEMAPGDLDAVKNNLERLARSGNAKPVKGTINALGRFSATPSSDGKDVVYAGFDAPSLGDLRAQVVRSVKRAGLSVASNHGFTPHMTLSYIDSNAETGIKRIDPVETTFSDLVLAVGGKRTYFKLGGRRA